MLNKQKSHVMYQLIAGIKYPRKQAGILSCRITLIAPRLQSHRFTVCFNFCWVYLAAPSPLSPSALTFCPAPNNSSLTYYQKTFLTPFHSLKCLCQMDKPPLHGGGHPTLLGPFLICPPPQNCFSSWPLRRDAAWPKSQTSLSAPVANGISHFYL